MKKFLLSILTFVYMAVSCGIAIEVHYCMGKKAGVEFYGSGNEKCGKCGMTEKKTGCCHDEHKFYKLDDSHKTVSNDINFTTPYIAVATVPVVYNWQQPVTTILDFTASHSPPDYSSPSACILNCVFRI
jgi:hypothetical protein